MNELIINNTTIVFKEKEDSVFTDSLTIAKVFKTKDDGTFPKDAHPNIMKAIKEVATKEDFSLVKIYESEYTNNRGRKYPVYHLDRDMFSLVVMGLTGKEAIQWKREYIKAFNAMEKKLLQPVVELTPLELVTKAYEIEANNHKETQKQLTLQKKISDVLENEINAIASTDGLLDMKAFSMLVTSRTNNVDFGRTKTYQTLRECGLVGDDTRPTQRGLNSYLEVKMVAGVNDRMYPKTFVIGDKFEKLLELMIRKIKDNESLNKILGYPFGE